MLSKKWFFILICVICVTPIYSQERSKLNLIPQIGLNISTISNDEIAYNLNDPMESSNKLGFSGGCELEYFFHPFWGVRTGVFYSDMGCKYKDTGEPEIDENLNYMSIPCCAEFSIKDRYYFFGGLQYSFLTHSQMKVKTEDAQNYDLNKLVKKSDLSIPIGFSYSYENVIITMRYNIGITDIYKNKDLDSDAKNRSFLFTLGYKIRCL